MTRGNGFAASLMDVVSCVNNGSGPVPEGASEGAQRPPCHRLLGPIPSFLQDQKFSHKTTHSFPAEGLL